jgi:hypothetical protein
MAQTWEHLAEQRDITAGAPEDEIALSDAHEKASLWQRG